MVGVALSLFGDLLIVASRGAGLREHGGNGEKKTLTADHRTPACQGVVVSIKPEGPRDKRR